MSLKLFPSFKLLTQTQGFGISLFIPVLLSAYVRPAGAQHIFPSPLAPVMVSAVSLNCPTSLPFSLPNLVLGVSAAICRQKNPKTVLGIK